MGAHPRYEVILYWSDPDQAFLAEVPELAGCAADGATYQGAIAAVEVVIREWIEMATELGRPIPKPTGRLLDGGPGARSAPRLTTPGWVYAREEHLS